MSTFQYPSVVSRTLDPAGKALKSIIAMHDRQITDADINLIQDLQGLKLAKFIKDHGVTSGATTYKPFQFNTSNPNTFFVPSFDVMFNNEVISIQGQLSSDPTLNRVQIPTPVGLTPGDEDARLYIVFLELWYQALNPITGSGYYPRGGPAPFYFYPYGGILPDPANATILPDDSVDPFQGLFTTERAQIQWRLNVQRVALDYDFTQGQFGFYYPNARVVQTNNTYDPGQIVYAQASLPSTTPGYSPLAPTTSAGAPAAAIYQFTNMGSVNGDTGLWRAGDGNVNNSLGTMDGYSYGMPVAVVFQRNTGNFDLSTNIFGCASPQTTGSGTLATRISGRLDNALADQIFPQDVVDTRSTISLAGIDMDDLMRKGFVDLIMGNTQLAVSRFPSPPGNKTEAVGSQLDYYVAMGPSTAIIPAPLGTFDGFANGFSADQRTFYTTLMVPINSPLRYSPSSSATWTVGDTVTISLPQTTNANITSVDVTCLVNNAITGVNSPAVLLQGQISISPLQNVPSKSKTVTFVKKLTGTAFDPGVNPLFITVGVTYPAGTGLGKIPIAMEGGLLYDNAITKTLPAYGISDYAVQAQQVALEAFVVLAINPQYSDTVLGTKIWITLPGSAGTVQTNNSVSQTTFVINDKGLNNNLNGLYTTRCWDFDTGSSYNISSRIMTSLPGNQGVQQVVTVDGAVDPASTVVFSVLAQDTVQFSYNAPVKAVTQVEETVIFGQKINDANFPLDPRVVVVSPPAYNSTTDSNTIVLGANGCQIKGISGNDVERFIWLKDSSGNMVATTIASATLTGGVLTVTVSGNGGALQMNSSTPFMLIGSILPAFDSKSILTLQMNYVPYQGEGVINRDYELLHSEDTALITTNGTGAAPIIGLADVYPYNRELPIITTLPAQLSWSDETLANAPVATLFDSNYVAMRVNNVEHTFDAPLHTNDFIPPINKDIRKVVRFTAAGQRGFSQAIPHLGFAIEAPTPRTVLGQNLQSTQASILLYVDNVNGQDSNTGLSPDTAKKSISSALAELPPVLRHPCTIILRNTGLPYNMTQIAAANSLDIIALGDGDIRATKQYALGNLSRVIQDEGRLVISRESTATSTVVIDATGFTGFGDGPTSAFYIENSRVILNGLEFKAFTNPAITAYDSDIDMVNCVWTKNVQAGAYVGCDSVILDGGTTELTTSGTGHVCVQSNITAAKHNLIVTSGTTPQSAFFVAERSSSLTLQQHSNDSLEETNIGPTTVVAAAQLNSSISVDAIFQSSGQAVLSANSVLLRTVAVNPFIGGVNADTSSSVVTQVG